MTLGILLGFFSFFMLSSGYVFVKLVGYSLNSFEINFFVALSSCVVVLLSRPSRERWGDMFRMRNPAGTIGRSVAAAAASFFAIYAFARIPFADAYTLLFLAPSLTLVLAAIFFREHVSFAGWVSILLGLAGVVIAVRPSFAKIDIAYGAAICSALMTAISVNLLRSITRTERYVTIVGVLALLSVVANGVLMIPGFAVPSITQLAYLVLAGQCSGLASISIVAALRLAPANFVAPTQYSQLVFVIIFSLIVFDEAIDWLKLLGMGLIGITGIMALTRARPPNREGSDQRRIKRPLEDLIPSKLRRKA